MRENPAVNLNTGHHGPVSGDTFETAGAGGDDAGDSDHSDDADGGGDSGFPDDSDATDSSDASSLPAEWDPEIVETVATEGEGVSELIETFDEHRAWLERSGQLRAQARTRYAEEIRQLLRADTAELIEELLADRGGVETLAERVIARETDPYAVTDDLLDPLADCVDDRLDES
jgi:LAO/AO transport system kinase